MGLEIEHLQKKLAHIGDMRRNISLKCKCGLKPIATLCSKIKIVMTEQNIILKDPKQLSTPYT